MSRSRAPTLDQKVDRLAKARDQMKGLMAVPEPWKFKQECESLFSEFRTSCVHLRNEREALDNVADKEVAWRFICRFSKESPFHNARCTEVLRILLLSDKWMKAFLEDPDVDVSDLPPEIAEEFGKRLDEVKKNNPDGPNPQQEQPKDRRPSDGGYPKKSDPWSADTSLPDIGGMQPLVAKSMTIVVQRMISCKLWADDQGARPHSAGPGIIVSVSMADGATEEGVRSAARFVLTAKVSGRTGWMPSAKGIDKFGGGAESVVSLCKRGEEQAIMVIPQLSLVSDIRQDGMDLEYKRTVNQHKKTAQMYDMFIDTLRKDSPGLTDEAIAAVQEEASPKGLGAFFAGITGAGRPKAPTVPQILAGDFGGSHYMEVKSAGPFMHSFAF